MADIQHHAERIIIFIPPFPKNWKGGMKHSLSEFLLVAIFPQTLFTFVRGNLMPFTLFTAGQELSPP